MSNRVNRQWRLAARPEGLIEESDFEWVEEPVGEPVERDQRAELVVADILDQHRLAVAGARDLVGRGGLVVEEIRPIPARPDRAGRSVPPCRAGEVSRQSRSRCTSTTRSTNACIS